jgi:hypothetical protein
MRGTIQKKGKKWYAVVYDGVNPATGEYRRRWVQAGTRRGDAEKLLAELVKRAHRGETVVSEKLTLGKYLTERWLPVQEARLHAQAVPAVVGDVEAGDTQEDCGDAFHVRGDPTHVTDHCFTCERDGESEDGQDQTHAAGVGDEVKDADSDAARGQAGGYGREEQRMVHVSDTNAYETPNRKTSRCARDRGPPASPWVGHVQLATRGTARWRAAPLRRRARSTATATGTPGCWP